MRMEWSGISAGADVMIIGEVGGFDGFLSQWGSEMKRKHFRQFRDTPVRAGVLEYFIQIQLIQPGIVLTPQSSIDPYLRLKYLPVTGVGP